MDNELSQLDALIESDVLDALGKTAEDTFSVDMDSDEILIEDLENDNSLNEDISDIEDTPIDNELEDIPSDEILIEDLEDENSLNEDTRDIETIALDTETKEIQEEGELPVLNEDSANEIEETPITLEQNLSSTSLSKLLSELLNNKTIEITIKIKE